MKALLLVLIVDNVIRRIIPVIASTPEFFREFPSVSLDSDKLQTPCLLLDEGKLRANVKAMKTHLEHLDVVFRPHLKTAKSIDVARIAMTTPQGPAMVSTLREAEYFGRNGVLDLIYGVGITPNKLPRVAAIRTEGIDLAIILDSLEQADAIATYVSRFNDPLPVFIEVDADGHRSGVNPHDSSTLIAIGKHLLSNGAELRGVVLHAGESYALSNPTDIVAAAEAERIAAVTAAQTLRTAGLPCPIVSVGSTPTARYAKDLSGVTEVRAGVFMFGDLYQAGVGTVAVNEIALTVLSSVIGHQRSKGWILIDAGWMAMSRDRGTAKQKIDQGYGIVCDLNGQPYADLILVDANQEHGVVALRKGSSASLPELPVGARVRILPNHACATAAQYDSYHVLNSSNEIRTVWPRINGW